MELVLVFRIADEWFGIEVDDIQEVVESPELNFVPRAPDAFIGAINVHGNVVPVVDLGKHLGLADSAYGERAIVLPVGEQTLALGVSAVHRIVPADPDLMLPCQREAQKDLHIRMLYNHDGKMINMLDIPSLLESLETF